MAPLDRSKRINLHATADEQEMLRQLAERAGLSMSDYLRQHIRNAHREAFGNSLTAIANEISAIATRRRPRKRKTT